jgi:hypothetical protein
VCARDDEHDLDNAAAKVRELEKQLAQAKEAYQYHKDHLKQHHSYREII